MNPKAFLAFPILSLVLASAAVALPKGLQLVDPAAPGYRWPAVDMDRDGVFDRVDHCVSTPPGCVVDRYGCSVDSDGDGVCDGVDRCSNTPMGTRVNRRGCPEPVHAAYSWPGGQRGPQRTEGVRITLDRIYFATSSAKLLPASSDALRKLGETLQRHPAVRVDVQGHADARGSARLNMKLSQARAEAVRDYLLDHFRLQRQNVTARGYGEGRPEGRGRNARALSRNRRVELYVLNPGALAPGAPTPGVLAAAGN